ncbi:MAG TPA: extracellular solute-binding protein [Candidatus Limnocylindrales bacterium]|nr:extracellular solute-binding protein [Candidatus Limnocylindrales bacterium]
MRTRRIWGSIGATALIIAACSSGGAPTTAPTGAPTGTPTSAPSDAPSDAPTATASTGGGIGEGEGTLNLVIWAGYAERGATDPAFDWVTPFEAETGCTVNTTDMTDSNNGVSLIQSGNYDGISASGDATTRLIQGGYVEAIDTSEFSNYANVFEGLKDLPHNTVDGVNYGVPHGRGPNLLMYNTETFTEAPTTWDAVWEGGSDHVGEISIYDSSIYIADAAVHLMATQPDLGITDPYQLNQEQFDAAIELLEQQAANDPLYWSSYTDQIASYAAGDVVVGTTWPLQVQLLQGNDPPVPVEGVKPDEGTTGWSDTWMLAKDADHPNCMKLWMNHMMSPEANSQATVWFGEAATSPEACEAAEALSPGHCDAQHADDETYWENIYYWSTPQEDCADDDAATTCKTQDDWVQAWTTLRGS